MNTVTISTASTHQAITTTADLWDPLRAERRRSNRGRGRGRGRGKKGRNLPNKYQPQNTVSQVLSQLDDESWAAQDHPANAWINKPVNALPGFVLLKGKDRPVALGSSCSSSRTKERVVDPAIPSSIQFTERRQSKSTRKARTHSIISAGTTTSLFASGISENPWANDNDNAGDGSLLSHVKCIKTTIPAFVAHHIGVDVDFFKDAVLFLNDSVGLDVSALLKVLYPEVKEDDATTSFSFDFSFSAISNILEDEEKVGTGNGGGGNIYFVT